MKFLIVRITWMNLPYFQVIGTDQVKRGQYDIELGKVKEFAQVTVVYLGMRVDQIPISKYPSYSEVIIKQFKPAKNKCS